MIVDANSDDVCHTANFNIGSGETTTFREWKIKVTHYDCGDDLGGPPGCLQYYTATTGTIQNFGFDPTITAVAADSNFKVQKWITLAINKYFSHCSYTSLWSKL